MSVYNLQGVQLDALFDKDGAPIETAYDASGNVVFSAEESETVDYSTYTVSKYCSVPCRQGFAIYGGYIFACDKDDSCTIISIEDDEVVDTVSITTGHGNSASFGRFQNPSDEFPLLYISHDLGAPSNNNYEYVYHIERSGQTFLFTLVQTLKWASSQTGYMANSAIDTQSNVMYMLGYSAANAGSDLDGTNVMILTAWDLNNLTDNGDGTFTPMYLRKTKTDYFIAYHFGQTFDSRLIWGGTGEQPGDIYAISPNTGAITYTIPLHKTGEGEGIAFLSETEAIVGFYNDGFYKYTFPLKEGTP